MFSQSDLAITITMKGKPTLINGGHTISRDQMRITNQQGILPFRQEFLCYFLLFHSFLISFFFVSYFILILFSCPPLPRKGTPSNENEINRSDVILIFQDHHTSGNYHPEDATYLFCYPFLFMIQRKKRLSEYRVKVNRKNKCQ